MKRMGRAVNPQDGFYIVISADNECRIFRGTIDVVDAAGDFKRPVSVYWVAELNLCYTIEDAPLSGEVLG